MVRWWLYKCEVCGVAVFSNQDHGNAWYNDCCGICKTWTYYDKVIVRDSQYLLPSIYDGYVFMCQSNKDSTEEQNVSDEQVNEH